MPQHKAGDVIVIKHLNLDMNNFQTHF